jgi:hypothetical protein
MITIELTGIEAKSLVINDGLSFFWKNRIDNARWEAVWNDGYPVPMKDMKVCFEVKSVGEGELQDLLMQSKNASVPVWFAERVYKSVCNVIAG